MRRNGKDNRESFIHGIVSFYEIFFGTGGIVVSVRFFVDFWAIWFFCENILCGRTEKNECEHEFARFTGKLFLSIDYGGCDDDGV